MESTTKTILLVPDEACAAEFRQALSSRYRSAVDGIDVYVAEGPLHEVLARARSRFGGAPLRGLRSILYRIATGLDSRFRATASNSLCHRREGG
jgi:hypothetical protein